MLFFKNQFQLASARPLRAALVSLIAVPVARVAFSLAAFASRRDRLYCVVTTIVLGGWCSVSPGDSSIHVQLFGFGRIRLYLRFQDLLLTLNTDLTLASSSVHANAAAVCLPVPL